jgi:hypothetical protein
MKQIKNKGFKIKRGFTPIHIADYKMTLRIIFSFKLWKYRFNIQKEEIKMIKEREERVVSFATIGFFRPKESLN